MTIENRRPNPIKCLDHGFVRLVDWMGSDLSVVRAARVSYDADWRTGNDQKSDHRLIHYLWSHDHTTPFEAVTFTFEVKAPIFVFRQWHRHRTQSYNEMSARYTELPSEFYVPRPEQIGTQDPRNKQGRIVPLDNEIIDRRAMEVSALQEQIDQCFVLYRQLLASGWPRELARSVLPVATYSHMFTTVNLLNLLRFLTLRADAHAQYEIRVYADALAELAKWIVPVCMSAWEKNRKVDLGDAR